MKNKIIVLVFALFLSVCGQLYAQNEGVNFVEGKTFAEALQMAKASNKLLFVDCYTSWCGPCKMMATKVFTQKKVGDYFNKEFICIKVDMEKGEGPDLHKRFTVRAYPTFLFIDGDGNEVNRIVGGSDADKFLKTVQDGVGAKSMKTMTARYEAGERSMEFLIDYLDVLEKAYASDKCNQIAQELLEGKTDQLLANEALYNAFISYTTSPLTPAFQYVVEHKAEFEAKYDKERLNQMMKMTWTRYPHTFVKRADDGTCTFDDAAMEEYVKEMKRCNVEDCDKIILLTDIFAAQSMKDWKAFSKDCSKYIKKYGEDDMMIYNWCLAIQKNCQDAGVKKTAVKWMKNRIKNIEKEEAKEEPLPEGVMKAMPMVNFKKVYNDMIEKFNN